MEKKIVPLNFQDKHKLFANAIVNFLAKFFELSKRTTINQINLERAVARCLRVLN